MSSAVNQTSGVSTWQGPVRGVVERDSKTAIAARQSATFDQLLLGIQWNSTQVAAESEEVAPPTDEINDTESTENEQSEESLEECRVESEETEAAEPVEALLQVEVAATTVTAKPVEVEQVQAEELVTDEGASPITIAKETQEVEGPVIEQAVDDREEVVVEETKVSDVIRTDSGKAQRDAESGRTRDRKRSDEPVAKKEAVQAAPTATGQPTKLESKDKVEVQSEAQSALKSEASQNTDEVRSNRRSRKERLAERAENSGSSAEAMGFPEEEQNLVEGGKPDNSVKAPERAMEITGSEMSPKSTVPVTAPPPSLTVNSVSSASESSAGDKPQAVGSVQSNSSTRSDLRSESASRSESKEPANKSEKAEQKPAVDQRQQIRLIQRVARGFERLSAEGGNIRLRLHPPELGSLAMTVRVEGRNLSAEITTETAQARQTLVENLPQLKQQLAESGITIERFDVRVAGEESAFSGQAFSQQNFAGQNSSNNTPERWSQAALRRTESGRVRPATTEEGATIAASSRGRMTSNRGLDVQV